ncbi:MAG: type II toxin-antitoxin system RelB/DinJ family antitoxin [Oscillospiraceae bacterium]|nr:type II toxin-antitoxin system RelB/DinJ family antitoxin [Oscillospiraceae bacterium]MCL2278638.1 type II toxin-antitoxin system RelB/DinJ family antitoxin [Oscillospiraceae bacterium]
MKKEKRAHEDSPIVDKPAKNVLRARVDADLHGRFEQFCENIGLRKSKAIELYMQTTLDKNSIPFSIKDIDEKKEKA